MNKCYFWLLSLLLTACSYSSGDDDELRTVPVTNNPHVIPNHGSGLPMMGGG